MRLGYVIVYVAHVLATLEFYERAFGLTRRFLHESGAYGELDTGATTLAFAAEDLIDANGLVARRNRLEDSPPGAEIGLVSEDVAGAFARAVAAGATPCVEPKAKPWGQIVAWVRDPNGFLVEICSPMG